MSATALPRFELDAVRDLAGAKVFARGKTYCDSEQVRLLAVEPARVLALVAGTEDYRTELTGLGRKIGGTCSCPAFDDWGFCKHMVATALAANAAGGDAGAEGATARIRRDLTARGADALAGMIMDLAERDLALFRRLDLESATLHADDKTLEARLRRSIDEATRTGRFVEYDAARDWAEGVSSVLDSLAAVLSKQHAAMVLRLAEQVIDRVILATDSVDDSDNHCSDLLEHAREMHLQATRMLQPDPVRLACSLFAREIADDFGMFNGAADDYADVLGAAGLAEYHRLATEAWDKLPVLSPRMLTRGPVSADHPRLLRILDGFAARAGDVDGRIALRIKNLSSAWSYVQLAEFCQANGRIADALRHAEDGLWIFADHRQDPRLLLLATELLAQAGRTADAAVHLWRAFESRPSLDLYHRLAKLDGKTCARAIGFLEGRLGNKTHAPKTDLADVLVGLLTAEKMFAAAWQAVRVHAPSERMAAALAKASETKHPAEAVQTYARTVERLACIGGHPAYAEAVALVARMAKLRPANEHKIYLDTLKASHSRKRNFLKLLL